jgi:hypothetical protein
MAIPSTTFFGAVDIVELIYEDDCYFLRENKRMGRMGTGCGGTVKLVVIQF